MFFFTQLIVPFFADLNALFPLSLLWPFMFVFTLLKAVQRIVRDEPFWSFGLAAGFALLVMSSPLILGAL